MMLIYYKSWIYQCLIKQVKSPSICSCVPETGSDPPIGSDRESGCDRVGVGVATSAVALLVARRSRRCISLKQCTKMRMHV